MGADPEPLPESVQKIMASGRADTMSLLVKTNLAMLRQAVQRETALLTVLRLVAEQLRRAADGGPDGHLARLRDLRDLVDKAIKDNEE